MAHLFRSVAVLALLALATGVGLTALGFQAGGVSLGSALFLAGTTALVLTVTLVAVLFRIDTVARRLEIRLEEAEARSIDARRTAQRAFGRLTSMEDAWVQTATSDELDNVRAQVRRVQREFSAHRPAAMEQSIERVRAELAAHIATHHARAPKRRGSVSRSSPFGTIHKVQDLEGIGASRSRSLEAIGIQDTRQLWFAEPAVVARAIDCGLREAQRIQHQAELMAIEGIDGRQAELLSAAGIASIQELALTEPEDLHIRLQIHARERDTIVGKEQVDAWVQAAKRHRTTPAEIAEAAYL